MSDGILIATVEKNALEEIRVSLAEFKGHKLLDVRTYASFDGAEERRATKNGISLKVEKLEELIGALQNAAASLNGEAA